MTTHYAEGATMIDCYTTDARTVIIAEQSGVCPDCRRAAFVFVNRDGKTTGICCADRQQETTRNAVTG